MDTLREELLDKIEHMKLNTAKNPELNNHDLEVLLLTALLEEDSHVQ